MSTSRISNTTISERLRAQHKSTSMSSSSFEQVIHSVESEYYIRQESLSENPAGNEARLPMPRQFGSEPFTTYALKSGIRSLRTMKISLMGSLRCPWTSSFDCDMDRNTDFLTYLLVSSPNATTDAIGSETPCYSDEMTQSSDNVNADGKQLFS
jgi:hypothetical protein